MSILPVILAGGSGSRLWPLSRSSHPKQFLAFNATDNLSMLQSTVMRLSNVHSKKPLVICNEEHRFFVAEQLREIDQLDSIVLEPEGRNTAPAVALAALYTKDDPIMIVMPADHIIQDDVAFNEIIEKAIPIAQSGKLVTFGITPIKPHTGYGYIKLGKKNGIDYQIDQFVEKPSLEKAKNLFQTNEYLWNSGIFIFKASTFLGELKKYRPEMYNFCLASMSNPNKDLDFIRVNKDNFLKCESESIDYAIMENTSIGVVVPFDGNWSDIGSWESLWDISEKDSNNNVLVGDVIANNCSNSLIRADSSLIAAYGIENLIIVATKDSILVIDKSKSENTKEIIEILKEKNRTEWNMPREVYRPWGKYDSIDLGSAFQVKRITVNPGAKLSVQMHHHRSEHWVVVAGQARVHYGSESFDLKVNESTYHGKEVVHALENQGEIPLELIEVQVGSYLGEDDIVRFSDQYGRS